MKRFHLLTALLLLLCMSKAGAQQYTYSITTSVGNSIPLGGTTNIRQNIYYPSDFPTAPVGTITKVYFQPSSGTSFSFTTLVIKMGYTSLSTFTAGPFATGLTTVYSNTASFTTNSGGWIEIPLQTPFFYTASQNFIVEASQQGYTTSMSAICDNSTAATDRTLYGTTSSSTGSLQARVMRLGFDLTPGTPCSAPTGLASGSVTNNSAALNWSAVSGSIGYEYVVDQTSANPSGSGTLTTSTSFNATSLTPNTTYYVHVRNKCSSSSFSSWVTISFTTQNFVSCYAPSVVSVVPTSTSTGILSWSPVPLTQGYEYVIDQNSGSPSGNGTSTTTTSISLSGLTGGASYYVHVRNVCAVADKSVWLNQQFTMPVCSTPANVLISNITDSTTDLLWSQMPNASGYDYAVDFSKLSPTTYKNTSGFAAHLSGLVPNSKYYLHVRARCFAADTSAWRLDSFVTLMVCYAPIVQVNGLGTNTPYAFWDPIPTAVGYEYTLTNSTVDPAFGSPLYTPYTGLTLPDDGKDYYLHVRTKCNSMFTFSQWSTVTLRTGMTNVSIQQQGDALQIYPNPTRDKLYLKGDIANSMITVTDVTGAVVLKYLAAGNAIQEINTSELPAGIYLLKISDGEQLQSVKFTKE
ncbi:fibronectin type III domain-containing protein [Polluticoccus soli]|uniref:T9SS type A sorting domain-containing protein n=1 Tax=Polluticoccus soli TaxID=3034150 RepID=UPI0023E1AF68|nr:T9SS type A sorting domain-containing protein [Flavipsychrobacter sp. JY13-12]